MVIFALSLCSLCENMSFAAGAFSGGARRGGGGGGHSSGDDGRKGLFSSKDKKGGQEAAGRDGQGGPTSITASLMFHAMASMSPSGGPHGSANREYAKDDPGLDNDRGYHHHHYEMAYDLDG